MTTKEFWEIWSELWRFLFNSSSDRKFLVFRGTRASSDLSASSVWLLHWFIIAVIPTRLSQNGFCTIREGKAARKKKGADVKSAEQTQGGIYLPRPAGRESCWWEEASLTGRLFVFLRSSGTVDGATMFRLFWPRKQACGYQWFTGGVLCSDPLRLR